MPATGTRRALFDRYVVPEIPVLLRVARSLTGQPADAEDLVQDTLVRAYRAIGTFNGAYPRAWLLTILRHAEINRHRKRRPDLLDAADLDDVACPAEATPESLVVGEAFDATVAVALRELPDKLSAPIYLVDVEGFTYAEAAQILGVPAGTIMSHLHRARARIRTALSRQGLAPRARRRL